MVFDKTGTLTHGKPQVVNFQCVSSDTDSHRRAIAILGTAESGSEHPLGQAVVDYCKEVRTVITRKSFLVASTVHLIYTVGRPNILLLMLEASQKALTAGKRTVWQNCWEKSHLLLKMLPDHSFLLLPFFFFQQLGVKTLGQVLTFTAQPGFGLSAQVTDVKFLLKGGLSQSMEADAAKGQF